MQAELEQDIPSLAPESGSVDDLTPNTIVVCINRGGPSTVEPGGLFHKSWKYDGIDMLIPVGYFKCEYRTALCFKARAVVPGSRNLEEMTQQSYIGIVKIYGGQRHIDDPDQCKPFTAEQLRIMGEKVEAIDRGDDAIQYLSTKRTGIGVRSEGRLGTSQTAFVGKEQVAVADVLTPPEDTPAARVDTAQAQREGALPPQAPAASSVVGRTAGGGLSSVKDKIKAGA